MEENGEAGKAQACGSHCGAPCFACKAQALFWLQRAGDKRWMNPPDSLSSSAKTTRVTASAGRLGGSGSWAARGFHHLYVFPWLLSAGVAAACSEFLLRLTALLGHLHWYELPQKEEEKLPEGSCAGHVAGTHRLVLHGKTKLKLRASVYHHF